MSVSARTHRPAPSDVAGTNLEHARAHNRRVVLEAVRRSGPLSRAEIARRTALTGQTISNIVEDLATAGLLVAGSPRREGRGQPSIPYSLNPSGAFSLGFHVDHRSIVAALADLSGQLVALRERPVHRPTARQALPLLKDLAAELASTPGFVPDRLLGAGIAVPVRFGVGSITTQGPTTLPGWDEAAEREAIAAGLGVPLIIENDATAAAIGERLHGAARTIDSFVFLFVDEGLGAGLFIDGQPWRGAGLNAGEIGHMIVEPDGRPCECGNRGCLERYVSLRAAYECVSDDPDTATPSILAVPPEGPGPRLARWLAEAGPRLRQAVNILESTLDPQTILVGGLAPEETLRALIAAAQPFAVSVGSRAGRALPRLMPGSAGRHCVALGAAALPIFDEINPRFDILMKR